MTFRTETEAWDEDTKTIKEVEGIIKKYGITEDNHFDLFSKVLGVSDRTSLCSRPEYIERIKHCKKLEDKICNYKK